MTPEELVRLTAAIDEAKRARDEAIVQAAHEGVSRIAIVRATGLTNERIRQIERAGGVPERRPGRRPAPE